MSAARRPAREIPELVTLVLSLAVVLALIGGVVYVQIARGDRPPAITAELLLHDVRVQGGSHHVRVEITNTGDQAAEAVRITVVQRVGDRDRQHDILIDYLAGHGTADATAVLSEDPRRSPPTVEVRSFLTR